VTNVIELDKLSKTYSPSQGEAVAAPNNLSFEVQEGSIFGLLGTNGAGKSTTVKLLSTCIAPSSGSARVMGFDIVKKPLEVRRNIAVVLQQSSSESLLNVQDNLMIYAYLHGVSTRDARVRAERVIEEFDLGDIRETAVQELSLGTKRRIQIAKIFMVDVPLIILDEPTTGMDPIMKRNLLDRLRAEARGGRTILLTTQVLSEAEELCDAFMILNKGSAMASGSLIELRRQSAETFRVSLSFERTEIDLTALLAPLNAITIKTDRETAELMIRTDEAALLAKLADISKVARIERFEVRGPTLEEIFINLVGQVQ
jgi:ABC-2 type transport system ATP-binding protein